MGSWLAAGALDDPFDRRGELRRVGRVALLQVVVEHDAVLVVDDLSLVAELDRLRVRDEITAGRVGRVGQFGLSR